MLNSQAADLSYEAQLYLWQKRTLYIGRFESALELSQGAATLTVSLDKPFSFITKDMDIPVYCRSLIIPAGVDITLDAKDALVANCNLDALGHDYATLTPYAEKTHKKIGYQLSKESFLITCFSHLFNTQMNSFEASKYLESQLAPLENKTKLRHVDPRIEKIIDLIQSKVHENMSGEMLASAVNLSIPRLAQLFRQQTGIPIRRYRLWHRLYLTAQHVGQGMNLTDAAIEAGFTDSSHFNHTFRSMLGMTPSFILSHTKKTRIII
jgi:AraC-like DNA-binding protein